MPVSRDGVVIGFNPPPILGMSTTGGFEFYSTGSLRRDARKPVGCGQQGRAGCRPAAGAAGVSTTFTTAVPQYRIDVDREKAKAIGIPINTIFDTMQASFGSFYVNDFTLFGRTYRVSLSSEPDFREKPDDLRQVFVRSDRNVMVPLNELVSVTRVVGPDTVDRFNIFPSAKILGGPAPGYSSGQAIARHATGRGRDAAQRLHDRLDRLGLSGARDPGLGPAGLRVRPRHGVPDPGRASTSAGRCRLPSSRRCLSRCLALCSPSGCAAWRTTSISRSGW